MSRKHRILFAPIWIVVAGAAAYLYWTYQVNTDFLGLTDAQTHLLSAQEPGRIVNLPVQVGDRVHSGDVLCRLDATDLVAERERLTRVLAEVDALADSDQSRFALEAERLRLQLENEAATAYQSLSLLESKKAELKQLEAEIDTLNRAEQAGLGYNRDLTQMRVQRDALASYIHEQDGLLTQVLEHRPPGDRARAALKSGDQVLGSLLGDRLKFTQQLRAQLALVEARLTYRVIHAPADGVVLALFAQTGDTVAEFIPILTLQGERTEYVDIYLPEVGDNPFAPGARVTVSSLRDGTDDAMGTVTAVAPGYDILPERLFFRGQSVWGRKVRARLDSGHGLVPGEAVRVRPTGELELAAVQAAPNDPAPTTEIAPNDPRLTPITVPGALKEKSRFEPSGMLWLKDIERYVVVSDDTGKKKADDHAPWLFLMDEAGRVEPEPVVLSGTTSLNDLESVTALDDARLLLLSSQSASKRGKRPADRQVLLEVLRTGRQFEVKRKIELFSLIHASYSPEQLAALGLKERAADDLPLLNIEGALFAKNALLLGLKQPTAPGGAILWRLTDLERVLAGERLAPGQLSLWRTVDLGRAAGRMAGISDLAQDEAGTLYALSTIPGADPAVQVGGCHRLRELADGSLAAEPLFRFAGLKPEGLSIRDARIRIAFDTDAKTPLLFIGAADGR